MVLQSARGRGLQFSDNAIATVLMLKNVFKLPLHKQPEISRTGKISIINA
nr:transposase [uncultured Tolumonas sp.]